MCEGRGQLWKCSVHSTYCLISFLFLSQLRFLIIKLFEQGPKHWKKVWNQSPLLQIPIEQRNQKENAVKRADKGLLNGVWSAWRYQTVFSCKLNVFWIFLTVCLNDQEKERTVGSNCESVAVLTWPIISGAIRILPGHVINIMWFALSDIRLWEINALRSPPMSSCMNKCWSDLFLIFYIIFNLSQQNRCRHRQYKSDQWWCPPRAPYENKCCIMKPSSLSWVALFFCAQQCRSHLHACMQLRTYIKREYDPSSGCK